VKDPWWLYVYWEISPSLEAQVRNGLSAEEREGIRSILRVYDVTDLAVGLPLPPRLARPKAREGPTGRELLQPPDCRWFDILLSGLADHWYIQVDAPNRSFVVDIGLLTKTNRFLVFTRSNLVTTPRCGPSDLVDEEWMSTEEGFWKLFGTTAGVGVGSSPAGLGVFWERRFSS
jgi:hypothetical protein